MATKIIAMGIECKSYVEAAKILGCSPDSIWQAVNKNRRDIHGKPFWFPGEMETIPIKRWQGPKARHCIIDGIEYESIRGATEELHLNKRSLRAALDMRDFYKGLSVSWVDREEE